MRLQVAIFDAYGTLFDVSAAAREAADEPGREALKSRWQELASHWRAKQLQYTWLRAVTGDHTDFWQVTQDGLDWAMEAVELEGSELRQRLLDLYWGLSAYPEVPDMLRRLKEKGVATGILSNGSPDMLDGAVRSAEIGPWLDAVLSVETVGIFKPSDRVYDMVRTEFGKTRDQVLFVSSNGWDAAAASAYGFQTAWVNRAGEPVDRLPGKPGHILSELSTIPEFFGGR